MTPSGGTPRKASRTPRPVAPHGGYRNLKSFQMAEIAYDGTVAFCKRFVSPRSRTRDYGGTAEP